MYRVSGAGAFALVDDVVGGAGYIGSGGGNSCGGRADDTCGRCGVYACDDLEFGCGGAAEYGS